MSIDFAPAEKYIGHAEQGLFGSGPFSESTIKDDLQNRQMQDNLSTMGSSGRQTYYLREKKEYYDQVFTEYLNGFDIILRKARGHLSADSTLISRCERCKAQAYRLLEIARNY